MVLLQKPSLVSKIFAEFLGTFVLVFGGCGAAVFAAKVVGDDGINMGIGFLGVALAFGLTVVVMAYAVGHVSGGHFNPAVTLGCVLAGRTRSRTPFPTGSHSWSPASSPVESCSSSPRAIPTIRLRRTVLATNGYGEFSPNGFSMVSVLIAEFVLTAIFLYVILGTTDDRSPVGMAPLAIGLSLTLIHLVAIPVSNTSVNPARSFGVAVFAGGDALGQVWVFFLAPLAGAAVAGLTYNLLFPKAVEVPITEGG